MREELSIDICEHGNEKGSCDTCQQEKYKPKSPREIVRCSHGKFPKDCAICSAIADTEGLIVEEEGKIGRDLTKSPEKGTTPADLGVPPPKGEELAPPSKAGKPTKKKLFGEGVFDEKGKLVNSDK